MSELASEPLIPSELVWRSVLPHLGYDLPPDLSPPDASGPVTAQLPLELVRQSTSRREWWPVPEPVAELYRRYRPTPLWRATRFEQRRSARALSNAGTSSARSRAASIRWRPSVQ